MDQEEQARRPEPQLTPTTGRGAAIARQGGWAGVLALLIVLAVVALLAGSIVRQYGLAGNAAPRAEQRERGGSASELVGGVAPVAPDGTTPAPRDALRRAHELENAVRQQASEYEQRIDAGTK